MHNIISRVEEHGETEAKHAHHEYVLGEAEWTDVERYVRLHELPEPTYTSMLLGACCCYDSTAESEKGEPFSDSPSTLFIFSLDVIFTKCQDRLFLPL